MKNVKRYFLVLIGAIFLTACANNSEEGAKEPVMKTVAPTGLPAEKLAPEKLEVILPDALMGMPKKIGSKGNPKMKGGAEISMARLIYREEGKEIQFEIYDSGTVGNTMTDYLDWTKKNLDNDDDKITEKTGLFKDFPSYEKYSKADKKAELHVLPSKRFELVMKGKNVTVDDLKQAFISWDIVNSIARLQ